MATGPITILLAVSAGVNFSGGGGSGLLLSFAGVLAGANIIAGGVRMAEDPAPPPIGPGVFACARALARRNNLALLGMILASSAAMAVAGEARPALCFGTLALLLLALSLTTIEVLGE